MKKKRKPMRLDPFNIALLTALSSMPAKKEKDELGGIDIAAEYELIQQKKSRLSRRLRDKVEMIYLQSIKIEDD